MFQLHQCDTMHCIEELLINGFAILHNFIFSLISIDPVLLVNGVTNVTASVGDNVTLTCKFLSLIAVNAVWLHNDSILDDAVVVTTSNDTTLYLSSVTESQSGTYTCILDNGIIEAAESSGSVTIGKSFHKRFSVFFILNNFLQINSQPPFLQLVFIR